MSIYSDVSDRANELSRVRCPYKDARARCTAKFDCHNQFFIPGKPKEQPVCTGSDRLDYRGAWEI